MNNKAFTTIELIVTMVLVIVIMTTITNVTFSYRDRSIYEENLTKLVNYKNILTKVIYDDILLDDVVSITKSNENNYKEIILIKRNGEQITLSIHNGREEGYIIYNNVKYQVPGGENDLVTISDIDLQRNTEYGLYSVNITISHQVLEEDINIHFVVT